MAESRYVCPRCGFMRFLNRDFVTPEKTKCLRCGKQMHQQS